jgi:hypothetical protein
MYINYLPHSVLQGHATTYSYWFITYSATYPLIFTPFDFNIFNILAQLLMIHGDIVKHTTKQQLDWNTCATDHVCLFVFYIFLYVWCLIIGINFISDAVRCAVIQFIFLSRSVNDRTVTACQNRRPADNCSSRCIYYRCKRTNPHGITSTT